ncbi:eCIS core domain-containing protein [Nitrosovibrio tenuis]|uniref:eCIS core domain-containing protein n=1 Tax=Nitrosovibrio tenuis TaxID=1233 RepID=A0A1H7MLZ1_9PROT|nr:DUF4157 domain-containing protein [Nitrosovibrio tenuis]SEL12326.1 protein of unknown function [Nitrosovibrio tenuis]
MSQPLLTESSEKAKQRAEHRGPKPDASPSFQHERNSLLQLQRTLGNQRVAQLIQTKRVTPEGKIIGLQPKLTVGAADDQYEQEADRVARHAVSTPDSAVMASLQHAPQVEGEARRSPTLQSKRLPILPLAASITPFARRQLGVTEEIEDQKDKEEDREEDKSLLAKPLSKSAPLPLQRQVSMEEKETGPLQPKSTESLRGSFEAGDDVEFRLSQSRGQGSPLPDSIRAYMEPRFGVDFSHVRVHTHSNAIQMSRDIGARAFTHGLDIFFGAGGNPTDLELTAHELTHVVQQTGAPPLRRQKEDDAPVAGLPLSPQLIPLSATRGSPPKLSDQEDRNDSHPVASAETGAGTVVLIEQAERHTSTASTADTTENIRGGAARPAEAAQAAPLLAPNLTTAAETKKSGEPSELGEPSTVPLAMPDVTNDQLSGGSGKHKMEEAASPASELLMGGNAGIKKQGGAESAGMEQITIAPDSPLKPHAIAQARLINNDCLHSEEQVAHSAATRRQQISEHFSGVRRGLSGFLTKSITGVRSLVTAKQSEIIAASARMLGSIRAVIVNALQAAEAQSNEIGEEINGAIESITASVQERVGGIADQIVNVINVIPLPDLPGVAQIRGAAVNLLRQAAGVVNGAIGQGIGFIRSAFNAGMNLLSSFFRVFKQLVDQALALAASAIQRMMQLIFQALNQLLHLIVSTLENALSSAIAPLLNRLEAALIQAVSRAEQHTLAQIRANRTQHLAALASAVNPAAGGGTGQPAANKAASMDDSIAAIRTIGLNAIQNNRLIIQSFEEQTSSIAMLIFQGLTAAAGQIMQEISTRIAQAVEMIVSKVSQVIQSFMQLMQAVVTFIQTLIQAWAGALARIVQYVRSLAQHPVDQLIDFAQKTLSRMRDFISRLIQNFISSGGSIVGSIAETIGVFKLTPSLLGPAPAFAGPPIQIIGGLIIILIAGVAYVFPVWVGIIILVVVALLLLLLLYLLLRWLFKPRPVPPPPPPPPPPPVCNISTRTLAAAPDGTPDTRKTVGVNEQVEFISASPATWSALHGTIAPTSGTTAIWTAPDKAVITSVKAILATGKVCLRLMFVVTPNGANITEVPGTAPAFGTSPGLWGAGFQGNVFIEPKNVSFQRVVFGEGTVASVVTPAGGFQHNFTHPANTFGPGHPGSAPTGTPVSPPEDNIVTEIRAPVRVVGGVPICGNSDFLWAIPWEFSVAGGPRIRFATANHHSTSTLSCDASIEKGGAGPFVKPI